MYSNFLNVYLLLLNFTFFVSFLRLLKLSKYETVPTLLTMNEVRQLGP